MQKLMVGKEQNTHTREEKHTNNKRNALVSRNTAKTKMQTNKEKHVKTSAPRYCVGAMDFIR